jgi:hypothetical protein
MPALTFITLCCLIFAALYQVIYFLCKRTDRSRLRFFFLLLFLLGYNFISFYPQYLGITPSIKEKAFPFLYASMSIYYAYFFYKALALKRLEVLLPAKSLIILSNTPLALLIFASTLFHDFEEFKAKLPIVVPFVFSLFIIVCAGILLYKRYIHQQLREETEENIWLIYAAYVSLLGFTLAPLAIPNSLPITNIAFLSLIVTYIVNTVSNASKEEMRQRQMSEELWLKEALLEELKSQVKKAADNRTEPDYALVAQVYGFCEVEIKILQAIITHGLTKFKDIADHINLSESSAKKYVGEMKEKTDTNSPIQLAIKVFKLSLSSGQTNNIN